MGCSNRPGGNIRQFRSGDPMDEKEPWFRVMLRRQWLHDVQCSGAMNWSQEWFLPSSRYREAIVRHMLQVGPACFRRSRIGRGPNMFRSSCRGWAVAVMSTFEQRFLLLVVDGRLLLVFEIDLVIVWLVQHSLLPGSSGRSGCLAASITLQYFHGGASNMACGHGY